MELNNSKIEVLIQKVRRLLKYKRELEAKVFNPSNDQRESDMSEDHGDYKDVDAWLKEEETDVIRREEVFEEIGVKEGLKFKDQMKFMQKHYFGGSESSLLDSEEKMDVINEEQS